MPGTFQDPHLHYSRSQHAEEVGTVIIPGLQMSKRRRQIEARTPPPTPPPSSMESWAPGSLRGGLQWQRWLLLLNLPGDHQNRLGPLMPQKQVPFSKPGPLVLEMGGGQAQTVPPAPESPLPLLRQAKDEGRFPWRAAAGIPKLELLVWESRFKTTPHTACPTGDLEQVSLACFLIGQWNQ